MDLLLRVVGWPDDMIDRPALMVRFDASGGLIGRAESARLSLPDPKRTVSRFHGHVSFEDGAYYLEDMGSPNPPLVNGRAIPTGQRHQIRPGDQIRIGQYTIAVEFDDPDFPATQILDPSTRISIHEAQHGTERTQVLVRESPGVRGAPGADDSWQAFLAGAQIHADMPPHQRPEAMRLVGSLLRVLVGGLRRLALSPGDARFEPDGDASAPRARPNNPIRFAADDKRAIGALLKPPTPGFLSGPAAIEELVAELIHDKAAARAALTAAAERLFARLAPSALEMRAAPAGAWMAWFPSVRKRRLWDRYLAELRQLTGADEDTRPEALGKLFADACAAEAVRQRKARRKDAPTV